MPIHIVFIIFLFLLGACIGSFLNVVVWRLPRDQSLVSPPSHCPKCQHRLAFYDNIPIFGWIFLGGRCRYCAKPISIRYPIVELITALLLVFYYLMYFVWHVGPCTPASPNLPPSTIQEDWPIYALDMFMICSLVAVTLIDAELFIIPLYIPWLMAAVGLVAHAVFDRAFLPGSLNLVDFNMAPPRPMLMASALSAGAGVGLVLSILMSWRGKMPTSFPDGEPVEEIDQDEYKEEIRQAKAHGLEPPPPPITMTKAQIRTEIRKEMLFLMPPMILGIAWVLLTWRVPALRAFWRSAVQPYWVTGLLGAALGAMVGGLIVWLARIIASMIMGRVAMGLGDVHLMFGIGAIVGAGAALVTFFLSPFPGVIVGLWGLITRRRHTLPLGPYLSLGAAAVLLFYCPIAAYFEPGLANLASLVQQLLGM